MADPQFLEWLLRTESSDREKKQNTLKKDSPSVAQKVEEGGLEGALLPSASSSSYFVEGSSPSYYTGYVPPESVTNASIPPNHSANNSSIPPDDAITSPNNVTIPPNYSVNNPNYSEVKNAASTSSDNARARGLDHIGSNDEPPALTSFKSYESPTASNLNDDRLPMKFHQIQNLKRASSAATSALQRASIGYAIGRPMGEKKRSVRVDKGSPELYEKGSVDQNVLGSSKNGSRKSDAKAIRRRAESSEAEFQSEFKSGLHDVLNTATPGPVVYKVPMDRLGSYAGFLTLSSSGSELEPSGSELELEHPQNETYVRLRGDLSLRGDFIGTKQVDVKQDTLTRQDTRPLYEDVLRQAILESPELRGAASGGDLVNQQPHHAGRRPSDPRGGPPFVDTVHVSRKTHQHLHVPAELGHPASHQSLSGSQFRDTHHRATQQPHSIGQPHSMVQPHHANQELHVMAHYPADLVNHHPHHTSATHLHPNDSSRPPGGNDNLVKRDRPYRARSSHWKRRDDQTHHQRDYHSSHHHQRLRLTTINHRPMIVFTDLLKHHSRDHSHYHSRDRSGYHSRDRSESRDYHSGREHSSDGKAYNDHHDHHDQERKMGATINKRNILFTAKRDNGKRSVAPHTHGTAHTDNATLTKTHMLATEIDENDDRVRDVRYTEHDYDGRHHHSRHYHKSYSNDDDYDDRETTFEPLVIDVNDPYFNQLSARKHLGESRDESFLNVYCGCCCGGIEDDEEEGEGDTLTSVRQLSKELGTTLRKGSKEFIENTWMGYNEYIRKPLDWLKRQFHMCFALCKNRYVKRFFRNIKMATLMTFVLVLNLVADYAGLHTSEWENAVRKMKHLEALTLTHVEMRKVDLNLYPEARCMDGSPGLYWKRRIPADFDYSYDEFHSSYSKDREVLQDYYNNNRPKGRNWVVFFEDMDHKNSRFQNGAKGNTNPLLGKVGGEVLIPNDKSILQNDILTGDQDILLRSRSYYGSSNGIERDDYLDQTIPRILVPVSCTTGSNLRSKAHQLHSPFCGYNLIVIHYCDGNFFSGNRKDAYSVEAESGLNTVFFNGQQIVDAVIEAEILPSLDLSSNAPLNLVLLGSGTGGTSALRQAQRIRQKYSLENIKVASLGGYVPNVMEGKTRTSETLSEQIYYDELENVDRNTEKGLENIDRHPTLKSNIFRTNIPVFIGQSINDPMQLKNIFASPWFGGDLSPLCLKNLEKCSNKEASTIVNWEQTVEMSLSTDLSLRGVRSDSDESFNSSIALRKRNILSKIQKQNPVQNPNKNTDVLGVAAGSADTFDVAVGSADNLIANLVGSAVTTDNQFIHSSSDETASDSIIDTYNMSTGDEVNTVMTTFSGNPESKKTILLPPNLGFFLHSCWTHDEFVKDKRFLRRVRDSQGLTLFEALLKWSSATTVGEDDQTSNQTSNILHWPCSINVNPGDGQTRQCNPTCFI